MSAATDTEPRGDGTAVGFFIGAVASAAVALAAAVAPHTWLEATTHPGALTAFIAATLVLASVSAEVYGRGTMTFAGTGMLALGIVFGAGPAMVAAILSAAVRMITRRGKLHRAVFDASAVALAAGSAALAYHAVVGTNASFVHRLGPATLAATIFLFVNIGLLTLAMSLSENVNPLGVWSERFRWLTLYYIASAPLALVLAIAYEKVGVIGLLAFSTPPAFMMFSVRLYLARTRESVEEVRRANNELEQANEELKELSAQLRQTHRDTIAALSRSMEAKDYYTGGHTERVSEIAVAIATRLGVTGDDLEAIEIGALLHDIGKIGIPEQILHKNAPLDEDEWIVMKEHPVISDFILTGIDLHPFVRQIARSSHERLDGTGYPDELAGEDIPLPARIVFVADAVDAITSERPYRAARTPEHALVELRRHAGTQFCPRVVSALEQIHAEDPSFLDSPGVDRQPRLRRVA